MRLPTVYVEPSIPSLYHESRPEPAMQARREWTRQWWSRAPARYELFTSEAVLDELARGEYATKADCLALVQSLPVLPIGPETADFVSAYLRHKLMPRDPAATHCTWRWPASISATSCALGGG